LTGQPELEQLVRPSLSPSQGGALDGLLVADFSRVLAGPYLTMLLGDLGATVVKVESPDGDQTRRWGPPWRDGDSTYYLAVNRGKRSVVLDLADDRDRRLAVTLASHADVLVENMMPGRMARFGLDYQTLSALNTGLVYCSLTGFGTQPAAASLPGFDLVAQAASGLMSVTGDAAGPATKVGVALVDVLCGLHATVGILAALQARARSGRGQLVESNLMLSALSALTNQAAGYLAVGVVPSRLGNAHPSVAPYEVFPVLDGEIVIAAGTDRQFTSLCSALGRPQIAAEERFATNSGRVSHRDELREALVQCLRPLLKAEALQLLHETGVPAGPVNDMAEAFELARSLGLDAVWQVDGVPQVRTPFQLSCDPPRPTSGAPALDGQGMAVREWLASMAELPRAEAEPG
jgi:crotonobetainyl-CoA:carnitine CoA-transferase CaiB-like acyl-CoA transferase